MRVCVGGDGRRDAAGGILKWISQKPEHGNSRGHPYLFFSFIFATIQSVRTSVKRGGRWGDQVTINNRTREKKEIIRFRRLSAQLLGASYAFFFVLPRTAATVVINIAENKNKEPVYRSVARVPSAGFILLFARPGAHQRERGCHEGLGDRREREDFVAASDSGGFHPLQRGIHRGLM